MEAHHPKDLGALQEMTGRSRSTVESANGLHDRARARQRYFSRTYDVVLPKSVAPAPAVNQHANIHLRRPSSNTDLNSSANPDANRKERSQSDKASNLIATNIHCDQFASHCLRSEELPFAAVSQLKSASSPKSSDRTEKANTPLKSPRYSFYHHLATNQKSRSLDVLSIEAPHFSSLKTAAKPRQEKCRNTTSLLSTPKKRPRIHEHVSPSHFPSPPLSRERKVDIKRQGDRSREASRAVLSGTVRSLLRDELVDKNNPLLNTNGIPGRCHVEREKPLATSGAHASGNCNVNVSLRHDGCDTDEAVKQVGSKNVEVGCDNHPIHLMQLNGMELNNFSTPRAEHSPGSSGVRNISVEEMRDSDCQIINIPQDTGCDSQVMNRCEPSAGSSLAKNNPKKDIKGPKDSIKTLKERVPGISTPSSRRRHQHSNPVGLLKTRRKGCMGVDRKRGDEFDNMVQQGSIDACLADTRKYAVRKRSNTHDCRAEIPSKRCKRAGQKLLISGKPSEVISEKASDWEPDRQADSNCLSDERCITENNEAKRRKRKRKSGIPDVMYERSLGARGVQNSAGELEGTIGADINVDETDCSQSFYMDGNQLPRLNANWVRLKNGNQKNRKESGNCSPEQPLSSQKVESRGMSQHQNNAAGESPTSKVTVENGAGQEGTSELNHSILLSEAFTGPPNLDKDNETRAPLSFNHLREGFDFIEEDVGEVVGGTTKTTGTFVVDNGVAKSDLLSSDKPDQLTPRVKPSIDTKKEDAESNSQCVTLSEDSSEGNRRKGANLRVVSNEGNITVRTRACDLGRGCENRRRMNEKSKLMPSCRMFAMFAPDSTREKEQRRKVKGLAAVENDDGEGGQIILRSVPPSNGRGKRRLQSHRSTAPMVVDLTRSSDSDEPTDTDIPVGTAIEKLSGMQLSEVDASKMARQLDTEKVGRYLDALSHAEAKVVETAFECKGDTVLVTLKAAGITLRGWDIQKLGGTRWLNDEIINAYVHLINERNTRLGSEGAAPRTYVFNTFFYTRLTSGAGGYDYAGVRRWTSRAKVDVLRHDLLLVPVNLGNHHWVLSGIDMKNHKVVYLDSMHGSDKANVVACLQRWIYDEVKSKHGAKVAARFSEGSWEVQVNHYNLWRTGVLPFPLELPTMQAGRLQRMPKQEDGGSCGVFIAKTADCLALGVIVYLRQKDVRLVRKRMVLDLLRKVLPS